MSDDEPQIILFDGVCNFCSALVQFVIRHDGAAKFRFAALQSEAGQKLLREFGLPVSDFGTFVYLRGDRVFLKSTAALRVLRDFGGGWRLAALLLILPRFVRDFGYDLIAKLRYRIFGKRTVCFVPTPELRARFLDENGG